MTDLGTLGEDMHTSAAMSITPAGQVVGESVLPGINFTRHAFLFTKGLMVDLGTLGGNTSVATGINPAGQVVGSSNTVVGGSNHATLWTRK
jgi:probable HAF family extracellular repeat protein